MRTSSKNKKLSSRYKSDLPDVVVEEQTKKIPNLLFLGLGLASLVGQAAMQRYIRRRFLAPVLGVWGPVFLIFGLYNKLVKLEDELLPAKAKKRRSSMH